MWTLKNFEGPNHVYRAIRFFSNHRLSSDAISSIDCVQRYGGDYKVQKFSCFEQFLCMGFAELTYRESLRDIETCLRAVQPKLYHAGIRSGVSKSTLADANEKRDWRIYADFAQVLIAMARPLYSNEDLGIDLDNTLYALDSTTIDLCLSLSRGHVSASTRGR